MRKCQKQITPIARKHMARCALVDMLSAAMEQGFLRARMSLHAPAPQSSSCAMRLDRLDLNLLVALDALLTERHVTKAGERLSLSQSATSAALSRLRIHFEDDLIVRTGRTMTLTPFAEGLVLPVRDILLRVQSLASHRSRFEPATSPQEFTLVASDFVIELLVPGLLQRVSCIAPQIGLKVFDLIGSNLIHGLDHGDFDMIIVPAARASSEHPSVTLIEDEWSCLVWSGSRWGHDALDLDAYVEAQHVEINFGQKLQHGIVDTHLAGMGLKRNIAASIAGHHLLPQVVIGAERIATVPSRLARRAIANNLPVHMLPPPLQLPPVCEVLQWSRYRDSDPAAMWLVELIREIGKD